MYKHLFEKVVYPVLSMLFCNLMMYIFVMHMYWTIVTYSHIMNRQSLI